MADDLIIVIETIKQRESILPNIKYCPIKFDLTMV